MAERDVERLRGELRRTIDQLVWLGEQAEVLHSLAFEPETSSGDGDKVRSTRTEFYLDEVGRADAKGCWNALRALVPDVGRVHSWAADIFSGPSADESLRGTLMTPQEYQAAIAAQRRRRRRDEFTPPASEHQPAYPRGG